MVAEAVVVKRVQVNASRVLLVVVERIVLVLARPVVLEAVKAPALVDEALHLRGPVICMVVLVPVDLHPAVAVM